MKTSFRFSRLADAIITLMEEYILMGVMAAATLGLLLLRTNTAVCFFALCGGSVLLSASGENASLVATSLTSGNGTSSNVVKIALLLSPLIVCAVLLRHQLPKGLLPMAFIPAVATALLAVLLTIPLLPEGSQLSIKLTETWEVLTQYQEPITGVGLIVSVVLLALSLKRPGKHHKKH